MSGFVPLPDLRNGISYSKNGITFSASRDVERQMWVGLSIAQSDIDFWLDNFRFFEGQPKDEIPLDGAPQSVDAKQKLTTQWASVKSKRF